MKFPRPTQTWKSACFLASQRGDFLKNSGILQLKKIGAFFGCFMHGPVRLWLARGTDLKASNRTVVFTINRAKLDCGDIGAHHAFGWGILLAVKVYNLV